MRSWFRGAGVMTDYGMNSPASGSSGEDLDPRPGLPQKLTIEALGQGRFCPSAEA